MPPKFKPTLGLQLPVSADDGDDPADRANNNMGGDMNGSLRMNHDGITVMSTSYNPYSFNAEGMSKGGGQHYKISENDLRIVKRLGAGASSTVFKAFLFRENKFVAIKKINVFDKDTRHQMLNDVKALCDAKAVRGLISFHGAYHIPDSGQICIVLEFMDAGSLGDLIAKVGRIPLNVLSQITAKVLYGLMYLHRKHMVHRDIKPANILVNLEGDAKISDFGISAFIDSTLAVCKTFLGTVTYMSPERIKNQPYSFAADIWSLGLALIEAATGSYPYDATVGPLQLMFQVTEEDIPVPEGPQYTPEFQDFVRLCMAKNPFDRPPAEELLRHPFIRMYEHDPSVNLKQYMQALFNPHDKLDEIALVFAWNYYALLSAGPDSVKGLEPLYSPASVLLHDGERARGRQAIMTKLKSVAQMHVGFKLVHQIKEVDCQPLGVDGSALVHVTGHLQAPGLTAGGNATVFSESFILSQVQPGEYYVANQAFRLLQ